MCENPANLDQTLGWNGWIRSVAATFAGAPQKVNPRDPGDATRASRFGYVRLVLSKPALVRRNLLSAPPPGSPQALPSGTHNPVACRFFSCKPITRRYKQLPSNHMELQQHFQAVLEVWRVNYQKGCTLPFYLQLTSLGLGHLEKECL